jgi:hypothetical protein
MVSETYLNGQNYLVSFKAQTAAVWPFTVTKNYASCWEVIIRYHVEDSGILGCDFALLH